MSPRPDPGVLPLRRYRMLDLSRLYPGPLASHILADLGMDVLKVEEPEPRYGMGRDIMTLPDPSPEEEVRWAAYNSLARNKRSIALNLLDPQKRPQSHEVFYKLSKWADVVLEGYRPGVAKWMGIDYETLRAHNAGIVYCSITGYGQTGPYAAHPGHDGQIAAVAGALTAGAREGSVPVNPGVALADTSGATYAVIAILTALIDRERTGEGQYIDVSMAATSLSLLIGGAADLFRERDAGIPNPPKGQPGLRYLQCKDGKYLTTGNSETYLWENFCRIIGRHDFIPLQHARGVAAEAMVRDIQGLFLNKTRDEWLALLRYPETCVEPVNTMPDALEDPQIKHLGMVWDLQHPTEGSVKQLGFPVRFSRTQPGVQRFAPLLGEHTREVLEDLGYPPERIAHLEAAGVVKSWSDGG